MLDYAKTILSKLEFDSELFWKEYRKAEQSLVENEQKELSKWLRRQILAQRVGVKPQFAITRVS